MFVCLFLVSWLVGWLVDDDLLVLSTLEGFLDSSVKLLYFQARPASRNIAPEKGFYGATQFFLNFCGKATKI